MSSFRYRKGIPTQQVDVLEHGYWGATEQKTRLRIVLGINGTEERVLRTPEFCRSREPLASGDILQAVGRIAKGWNSRKAKSPPSLSCGEKRTKVLLLGCCYQERPVLADERDSRKRSYGLLPAISRSMASASSFAGRWRASTLASFTIRQRVTARATASRACFQSPAARETDASTK